MLFSFVDPDNYTTNTSDLELEVGEFSRWIASFFGGIKRYTSLLRSEMLTKLMELNETLRFAEQYRISF